MGYLNAGKSLKNKLYNIFSWLSLATTVQPQVKDRQKRQFLVFGIFTVLNDTW